MDEPDDALDAAPEGEDLDSSSSDSPADSPSGGDSPGSSKPSGGPGGDKKDDSAAIAQQASKSGTKKKSFARFNVYLVLFIFVLVIALGVIGATYIASKKSSNTTSISSQSLSGSSFAQLANSDATVGDTGQVLNVQSSAIFAGKLLARQDLEVAGSLQVGGTVALNGLTVNGTTQFGQVQINKNLAVAGDTSLQGSATIAKSLQVNGTGNFSGAVSAPQLTTSSFQLNGDLVLTHHVVIGGATPSHSGGSALGSGGTASVSGSDSSGTVSINTGASPAAGCFVTVDFTAKFGSTPHVLLTPVGSSAGGLSYYVNRSTSSFSICDSSAPPASASFGFDYFVVD
ncbi:MAG TPA: hypothetical protein VLG27_02195 [Candidatus Saccharimonadia bacterium]|nr:hypothetical protein [Candidatus Saccharimonadia bacterium]